MSQKLNIGKIINEHLKANGITKQWLSKQICCSESCICKMLKKPNIDSDMILRISFILKHDFFQYLSDYYKENMNNWL
jgi:UTP-glucose-1-phosphate uridylyltransferase